MTVKQFKSFLQQAPDDAVVVLNAPDHSYREVSSTTLTTALFDEDADSWSQDFEDGDEEEVTDYGVREKVLVVE